MAHYIVIRGPLGVGKTTIAKDVAKKVGGKYVSVDDILRRNKLDKVKGRRIPLKNFIRANEVIAQKYSGKMLVIDGNFYYKSQIADLKRRLESMVIFTLKAPLGVCIRRDAKRKISYGKDATRAVYNLVSKFDYGTIINTKDKTPAKITKEILQYLKK